MFNQYLTINRRDYVPKLITNIAKAENKINSVYRKEFRDPINEGFRRHLCLDPCKEGLEELDSYFDKAVSAYSGFKKHTNGKPINKIPIRKSNIYDGRTYYQVVYCDIEKQIADKEYRRKHAVVLPNDIYVPLTSQKSAHRPPISINSGAYERTPLLISPNNLDPNYKVREILHVTTGKSEYMGIIGKLGEQIAVEELHGHMPLA